MNLTIEKLEVIEAPLAMSDTDWGALAGLALVGGFYIGMAIT